MYHNIGLDMILVEHFAYEVEVLADPNESAL